MFKNRLNKFICFTLAVAMVFGMVLTPQASSLSDQKLQAQEEKNKIQSQLNDAKKLVEALKNDRNATEQNIKELDSQIDSVESGIATANAQIAVIEAQIEELKAEIEENRTLLDNRMKDMQLRIVYNYENGRHNLLSAILKSGSIAEMINIVDQAQAVADYDRKMLLDYEDSLEELANQQSILYEEEAKVRDLIAQNQSRIDVIEQMKAAKQEQSVLLAGQITDAKQVQEVYEKELQAQNEALNAIIAAIAAEEEARRRAEQEAANQGKPQSQPEVFQSGFIWPCPSSHTITSDYGPRTSPTAGASTNHKGIDIGAARGSSILAVASGKVILAEYSVSAGNYVIISHGVNAEGKQLCSVYMHADRLLVAKGDSVSQGQEIAKVGSTGYSTGPHLHFAVTVGGAYVSPWGYVQ